MAGMLSDPNGIKLKFSNRNIKGKLSKHLEIKQLNSGEF